MRATPLDLQPWQNGIQSLSIKSGSLCSFLSVWFSLLFSLSPHCMSCQLFWLCTIRSVHGKTESVKNISNTRSTILCKSETVNFSSISILAPAFIYLWDSSFASISLNEFRFWLTNSLVSRFPFCDWFENLLTTTKKIIWIEYVFSTLSSLQDLQMKGIHSIEDSCYGKCLLCLLILIPRSHFVCTNKAHMNI